MDIYRIISERTDEETKEVIQVNRRIVCETFDLAIEYAKENVFEDIEDLIGIVKENACLGYFKEDIV